MVSWSQKKIGPPCLQLASSMLVIHPSRLCTMAGRLPEVDLMLHPGAAGVAMHAVSPVHVSLSHLPASEVGMVPDPP